MISPGCFYCSSSRGNFEMTMDVSVTYNFNFLYMSWVFSPAISISSFYWKFKIISISNYNQYFIFKKAWEELCRNFINYIWKSFELAVINIYCNIAMKSVPDEPRSGFPTKMVSFNFDLVQRITFRNMSYSTIWILTNPVEQHKVHEIKRFAHQRLVPCKMIAIARTGLRQSST